MKWTILLTLCLISTLKLTSARTIVETEGHKKQLDSSEEKSESSDESIIPLYFPKVITENDSHKKKDEIENRTDINGKVHKIHIDSEESKPGVRAYGLPKKNVESNGLIERIPLIDSSNEDEERNGRLVHAYGIEKKRFENNGEIERVIPPSLLRLEQPANIPDRLPRSIETTESKSEPAEDMETQDSKVFRPLFVYRQQQARKYKQQHYKCKNSSCNPQHVYH